MNTPVIEGPAKYEEGIIMLNMIWVTDKDGHLSVRWSEPRNLDLSQEISDSVTVTDVDEIRHFTGLFRPVILAWEFQVSLKIDRARFN